MAAVKTPWYPWLGKVPAHLTYYNGTMEEMVEDAARRNPGTVAYTFMGSRTLYPRMVEEIQECARALRALGIREGERVTIAMPNCPQAVIMFYAVNVVGAIANMIHPLSAEG